MEKYRILVIEDDESHREGLMTLLEQYGFEVDGAENGQEGMARLDQRLYDLVLTDYKMQQLDGMDFLRRVNRDFPSLKVIMVTGFGSVEHAVEAMREGAVHYIQKPVKPQKLLSVIREILHLDEDEPEAEEKARQLEKYYHFHRLVGQSRAMQQVYRKIKEVAGTDIPVLVTGESGTGKEMVAQAIHALSPRKNGPFIPVNTGALPRELIASELFGHLKGSFTGAVSDKKGKFEEANKGTLFLDEIGTMSTEVQISLLRVLETSQIERLGSGRPLKVDVRVVAASNEKLEELIEQGRFREDLYYRLNVFHIELPPLRERKEDIPYLANYYREQFNLDLKRRVEGFSEDAMALLQSYPWPGNVRELRNVILRALLSAGHSTTIKRKHLPDLTSRSGVAAMNVTFKTGTPLSEVEKTMIVQTIKAVKGNKLKAANILGISRRSLYNKLEEYQITDL